MGKSNDDLLRAAKNGDIEGIMKALESGANIEASDSFRDWKKDLMPELLNGETEEMRKLQKAWEEIEASDSFDAKTNLLEEAPKAIRDLLEAGKNGNIDAMGKGSGITALMWAAIKGHVEAIQKLLTAGANIKAKDGFGRTPLMWAAFNGHLEAVEALLKEAKKVLTAGGYKEWDGKHIAVEYIVYIENEDLGGQTALKLAEGNRQVMRRLLREWTNEIDRVRSV